MPHRLRRPEGFPRIIPYLIVKNAEASIDFYQRAFGFEIRDTLLSTEGKILHAEMTYNEGMIMVSPEGAYGNPAKSPAHSDTLSPVSLYVFCEDVDAFFAHAKEAGAKVVSEPEIMFWGDKMGRLSDPNGYIWSFATHVAEFDSSKIPAG